MDKQYSILGSPWRRSVVFLAALTFLGLLSASQLKLYYGTSTNGITWGEALISGWAHWYIWAALAPPIVLLARRFPFEPGKWLSSFFVHLPASGLFWILHALIRYALSPMVDSEPVRFSHLVLVQFHIDFLAYWGLVSCIQALQNYEKYRERALRTSQLEARLARAQLEVLKTQLHPHFLFNTLHTISALVHKDVEAADRMIAQLSDLLRLTLENIGVEEVTLQQELDFIGRYLAIQQSRFPDRLRVRLDIPAETLDALVPNQILQPLVENSIRHGIGTRLAAGLIELRARRENGMLQLSVRDDGPGLPVEGTGVLQEGIGLSNTRARLQEMYGQHAYRFELTNHPEGGTLALLAFPWGKAQGVTNVDEQPDGEHQSPDCG